MGSIVTDLMIIGRPNLNTVSNILLSIFYKGEIPNYLNSNIRIRRDDLNSHRSTPQYGGTLGT